MGYQDYEERYGNYNKGYNRYVNESRGRNNVKEPKHSGFDCRKTEDGKGWLCWGWKYSKRNGMMKMYARPYSKTTTTTSKSGKTWVNLFITLTYQDTGRIEKMSGLFHVEAKKLYIKELNMIGTKNGKGGYLGRHLGGSRR